MGKALEIISGQATAPSTTLTNLTMNGGNSLVVRNNQNNTPIFLLSIWGKHQTAGNIVVRSPQLHDNREGIYLYDPAALSLPLTPKKMHQELESQDTLVAQITGSATAGDIEIASMLIYYEDLIGINANLMNADDVLDQIEDIMAVENSLATDTAGGWSGEEAITAEFDNWKANRKYALLGYNVSAICGAVRWVGSDVGNLGVGGPGNAEHKEVTSNWFINLSKDNNLPLVPVFSSPNKDAIFVSAHQDENGTDVILTSIFGLLME